MSTILFNGIVLLLDKDFQYEIFNLGNDKSVELEKLSSIRPIFRQRIIKNYFTGPRRDFSDNRGDIEKARKFLGFDPKTDIEEGFKNLLIGYKEYYKV